MQAKSEGTRDSTSRKEKKKRVSKRSVPVQGLECSCQGCAAAPGR